LDNGLMPFLAVLDILSNPGFPSPSGRGVRGEGFMSTFSEILRPLREKFFISEEINFEFKNPNVLEEVKAKYADANIDNVDGYDFNYPDWRFNLRSSNTQNLLRVNLEASSAELLKQKSDEVVDFINKIK
jgi:phosphomannomutase